MNHLQSRMELTRRFAHEHNIEDIVAVIVAPEDDGIVEEPHDEEGLPPGPRWMLGIAMALCCAMFIAVAMLGV